MRPGCFSGSTSASGSTSGSMLTRTPLPVGSTRTSTRPAGDRYSNSCSSSTLKVSRSYAGTISAQAPPICAVVSDRCMQGRMFSPCTMAAAAPVSSSRRSAFSLNISSMNGSSRAIYALTS
jgi:hypothetical protein